MKKNTVYTLGSLIILLICAFCFVVLPAVEGRTSRQQGADIPVFGKYDGKEIKYEQGTEFANFVSQYGQMYQMYGQQLDQSTYYQIFNQAFKSTVLNYAYTDAVKESGYVVPQSAITREILPYFSDENGNYSSKLYKQASDEIKQELHDSAESSIAAERFANDNFASSSETVGLNPLYGLKTSSAEKSFIANMNKEQRGFKMAAFSKNDYPLDEKLKFANQNAALFNKYDMSLITVEEKSNAESIAKRIANNEITFEDAVSEYSEKNYSSSDGKLTNSYQYQIENILENKEDLGAVTGLAVNSVSAVIKTVNGYSLFKNNAAYEKPDFDSDDTMRIVTAYINTFESTLIEDYFTAKANDFIKEAASSDFAATAEKYGASTGDIFQFPLNYGNVDVLNTIDTSADGMTNAETNENFLSTAFSLKLDEISKPFVLNNYIAVLKYTTEGSSDDDDVNTNCFLTYDRNAATDAVMKSDKLENNFLSVYFDNYMR
jgi:hypothetical protein